MLRPSPAPPRLLVGVDDDTLKWTPYPLTVVRRQRALGADAVRVWVPWEGEAMPNAVRRDELARAETAARTTNVVLAVFGFARETPLTSVAQSRFCGYADAALALVPHADAVVVWNEANAPMYWRGTPAQYESLLAHCYDVLHRRGLTVLDSTASAHNPIRFLAAIARAYRASRRTTPLVDAFGHNPYPLGTNESPNAVHVGDILGEGDYSRLVAALHAFTSKPRIWYLEDGFQTRKLTPAQQAADVSTAIHVAACQHDVRAFFNFELVDETAVAGWRSGLLWPNGKPKPAAAAFSHAPRTCRP
ncbi:MAG TPA: hypothetical protein VM690_03705 [Gaiellaceae bacterium]|nr:hypothetical protein [Gaiellaceae bacterium]